MRKPSAVLARGDDPPEPPDAALRAARSARWLCVSSPLVRGRYLGAAVLDRNAAQRVVLALRVALPVVRHLDPGQRRVAVEDDAEQVPGLPLVPVVGGVDAD